MPQLPAPTWLPHTDVISHMSCKECVSRCLEPCRCLISFCRPFQSWKLVLNIFLLSHTQTQYVLHTDTKTVHRCLTESDGARVPGHCPDILQEVQAWLVSAVGLFTLQQPHQCPSVCAHESLWSARYTLSGARHGEEEVRIKAEGHFIRPLTLGDTVTKRWIRKWRNEMIGRSRERSHTQECLFLRVLYRSVLRCIQKESRHTF